MKNNEESFFLKVYQVTRLIPYGRVSTYGAIASYIASPQSARMVGWALNKCSSQKEFVPAYRVVNKKGILTGKNHFGTKNVMHQLLENEGVKLNNDQIIDFDRLFWDPAIEL